MIKEYIPQHLDYIEKNINNNSIIVYKGFSNDFLLNIAKKYNFLFDDNKKFINGKINLDYLKNNYKTLILSLDNKKSINILLYEELILLNSKNINIYDFFDGEVIIFENSLLSLYPNQSNSNIEDLEEKIDKEDNITDSIVYDFYSNTTFINGIGVIQYKSIQDEIEIKDFYDTISLDKSISNNLNGKADVKIVIGSNEYLVLLFNIFLGNNLNYNNIEFLYDRLDKNKIVFLGNIFFSLNVRFSFLENSFDNYLYNNSKYRIDFKDLLKKYWGYEDFRLIDFYENPDLSNKKIKISQGSLIEDIISQVEKCKNGNNKDYSDIFITAPTGAGKSIIFQVPGLYLANKYNYVTIVVSPLIALMNDQIQAMHNKGITNVDFINSEKSITEREDIINNIKDGKIDILYLSPELLLSYDISHFLGGIEDGGRELGLLVIDEAHLVTTWGRDFRVDYWYLGNYIRKVRKYNYNFIVLALTATAVYGGEDDMVFDTFGSLNMLNPHKYIGNIRRDDIDFKFREFNYIGNYNIERLEQTGKVIQKYITFGIKTIVYFPYTRHIKEMMSYLIEKGYDNKFGYYYGSLDKELKKKMQLDFLTGKIKVILTTKAFGMGVDIDDIKVVYHHAPSGSIPDYVQEIGRAARRKDIRGIAEIDYCAKDLNYSKALHGLSSVKQYECKLVLEKIYQIFDIKNKNRKKKKINKQQQNFLVSVEDFSYIFSENTEVENKLKNILLLLEKDLLSKYKFNVLIARPKQLFTKVFVSIENGKEKLFVNQYFKYIKKVSSIEDNERLDTRGLKVRDIGNIYSLDLGKLWEEKFVDKSFPILKKEFYENNLFDGFHGDVIPRYKLKIELNDEIEIIKLKVYEYFSKIENMFGKGELYGRYASENELDNLIKEEFEDQNLAFKIKEVLLKFYTSKNDFGNNGKSMKYDTFIQERKGKDGFSKEYRIINLSFGKVKNGFIKKFNEIFTNKLFLKYLSYKDKGDKYLKMASLIELLGFGTFEVEGGEYPQIFIRINDPYKLRKIVENGFYSNSLVSDIERRYKRSNELIDKFFTKMENNERWDFIENYFLGKI